jgi:hypothetical protein
MVLSKHDTNQPTNQVTRAIGLHMRILLWILLVSPQLSLASNIQITEHDLCKLTGETSTDSEGKISMVFHEPGLEQNKVQPL